MIDQRELESIESLWTGGIKDALAAYHPAASIIGGGQSERVALAAALVEVALDIQRLGGEAPAPPDLLRGDLCLARASRLLAETRHQPLQIAFARAIEELSAAAAVPGGSIPAVRHRLLQAIESAR